VLVCKIVAVTQGRSDIAGFIMSENSSGVKPREVRKYWAVIDSTSGVLYGPASDKELAEWQKAQSSGKTFRTDTQAWVSSQNSH